MEGGERGTLQHLGFNYDYQILRRAPSAAGPENQLELPPTLFLGGAFQSMKSWTRFVETFIPRCDVILVDLPGSGASDLLPARYGLDFLVDALEQLVRRLHLPPLYLVAASYGSPVAYQFARRFPERISHLTLSGIARRIPDRLRSVIERSVREALAEETDALIQTTTSRLLCTDPTKPIDRRRLAARVLASGIRQMTAHDRAKYVANSNRLLEAPPLDLSDPPGVRCLVFTGEFDVFTTPEDCLEVARSIPGAAYTTIPRADHLFHVEQFQLTQELIVAFGAGSLRRAHEDRIHVVYPCAPKDRSGQSPLRHTA